MTRIQRIFSALTVLAALATVAAPAYAQDWAKAALEKSSRHHEYVPVKVDGRTISTFVVYPEVKGKAPVIVLIHEIFGLSDWAKLMADEIAAKGYIVVAPDLLSGIGPNGGGTDAFAGQDAVTKAVSALDKDVVNADLNAVADYGKTLPSSNGKLMSVGFCWGGGKSFLFATQRPDLTTAFVFYGPPPPVEKMKSINASVYGFYAGNDARIGATIPQTVIDMKAAGKTYEPVSYEGAGHGFMRAGQAPLAVDATPENKTMWEANKKAFSDAFARLLTLASR